ncbi:HPr family phosphocarrier protein [Oceanivirga miroungae]|uniref:HPr family phosphocarrier protein n=1 Tax=Oceanivirga miroungae TaxID=1130046 RepID=A0A6I8MEK1_9FUSO|nr:HPr family phosphocarrier protein [Oceanivirga miroungae]VWL85941.1 HPr family phosphocarrier protein [Oceanivirga miroungae]
MKKVDLIIKNEQGLHARPSTKIVEITQQFKGDVSVYANDEIIDAKNVMGLMLLALSKGEKFTVIVESSENDDLSEQKLIDDLKYLVEVLKFDEI